MRRSTLGLVVLGLLGLLGVACGESEDQEAVSGCAGGSGGCPEGCGEEGCGGAGGMGQGGVAGEGGGGLGAAGGGGGRREGCLPSPPPGWQGPVVLFSKPGEGGSPEACTGSYRKAFFTGGLGVLFDEWQDDACRYSCGPPYGYDCAKTSARLTYYRNSSDCDVLSGGRPCDTWDGNCALHDLCASGGPDASVEIETLDLGSDSKCDPNPPVLRARSAYWKLVSRACTLASAPSGACGEGERPIPPDAEGKLFCIAQAGEVACPEVDYPRRQLRYAGFDDRRTCPEGWCNTPQDVCDVTVDFFDPTDATCGSPIATLRRGQCLPISWRERRAVVRESTESGVGRCGAFPVTNMGQEGVGEALGTVLPAEPMTFCCRY